MVCLSKVKIVNKKKNYLLMSNYFLILDTDSLYELVLRHTLGGTYIKIMLLLCYDASLSVSFLKLLEKNFQKDRKYNHRYVYFRKIRWILLKLIFLRGYRPHKTPTCILRSLYVLKRSFFHLF